MVKLKQTRERGGRGALNPRGLGERALLGMVEAWDLQLTKAPPDGDTSNVSRCVSRVQAPRAHQEIYKSADRAEISTFGRF
jgi:hypothetical protein